MTKEYLLEDLQRLFEKTRTQALRFAQLQGWTVEKKKIGKVYKYFYTTTGTGTAVGNSIKFGVEIGYPSLPC